MIATPAPTLGRAITAPTSRTISIARGLTIAAAFLFQVAGLYATVATFGVWITLTLYAAGGLAVVLQHVVARMWAASW
jgi:hypothetical protein